MSTKTRTLPAHGTLSRHKHYGCKCEPCADNFRAYSRRRYRQRGYGTWQPYVDAEAARSHVRDLRDAGLSIPSIIAASGVSAATIARLLYGAQGQRPAPKMRRESAEAILAVRAEDCPIPDGARVDGTGTRRRIQALVAAGWTFTALGPPLGIHPRPLGELARARHVTAGTARRVKAGYKQLSTTTPAQRGVTGSAQTMARNLAGRNGWAPPGAWDDNIDTPTAQPDWTGHCGTDRGWWMHRLQKLSTCSRCDSAHEQWLDDHKHLPPRERFTALGQARAAASNRGQDIADDARELLALDYPHDVVAARLRITKEHLYQELRRHPKPARSAVAA